MLIKEKPALYIGKASVIRLAAFIDGYLYSRYLDNGKNEYITFCDGFNEWIQKKYNINSSHRWSEIILFF